LLETIKKEIFSWLSADVLFRPPSLQALPLH